nr:hypothetical protein BaRGS_024569 [Batillaria attramentaria]
MNAYFSSLKIFTATQCHCQMSGVEPTESEEKVPGASVPDECITEMEEAAFMVIEFGLEKEDNEEEVAGAEESEAGP